MVEETRTQSHRQVERAAKIVGQNYEEAGIEQNPSVSQHNEKRENLTDSRTARIRR